MDSVSVNNKQNIEFDCRNLNSSGGGGAAGDCCNSSTQNCPSLQNDLQAIRKPPAVPKIQQPPQPQYQHQTKKKPQLSGGGKSNHRVRSASTGRDKKSELQARYWALLFGNLQRAINEIYQTVECYENMSSCQETILVLENYIRDFKALAEWFRVSWDYESTPLPQRPQSLAWEVRKSNPTPRVRTKSLNSPIMSGKSSPVFSGKSSPCSDENRTRKGSTTRLNIRELFSNSKNSTIINKRTTSLDKIDKIDSEKKLVAKIIEKHILQSNTLAPPGSNTLGTPGSNTLAPSGSNALSWNDMIDLETNFEEARQEVMSPSNNDGIEKFDQYAQTDLEDDNLTLAEIREKIRKLKEQENTPERDCITMIAQDPSAVELTVLKLNSMENEELTKKKEIISNETELKKIEVKKPIETVKDTTLMKKSQQSPMKYSSVVNKTGTLSVRQIGGTTGSSKLNCKQKSGLLGAPASQKTTTLGLIPSGNVAKKLPAKQTIIPNLPKQHSSQKPIAPTAAQPNKNKWVPPSNVANRLSARSRTMIDMTDKNKPLKPFLATSSRKSSREDIGSSSSTLKASNEKISNSRFNLNEKIPRERRSEPKQFPSDSNDGWLTVKNRRRSSLHWANRFNQPTGYASLPTLALLNEKDEKLLKSGKKNLKEKLKQKSIEKVEQKVDISLVKLNKTGSESEKPIIKVIDNKTVDKKEVGYKVSAGRQNVIKRQKSDLTGLKMTSLHKEFMRSDKYNSDNGTSDNAQQNTVENKVKVEYLIDMPTEDDGNKIDIKIQTNREFSKAIGDLYESLTSISIGAKCDPNGLSSCDEYEERDESDEDQRKLLEEQESLERQIFELQNTEIDVDTETDETDCDIIDQDENTLIENCGDDELFVSNYEDISLEMRYKSLLSEMSWGEREEALATLQAYVSRHPGRAQILHQKLSSPSRRRSLQETLKKYQAKQNRAKEKRELLQKEKAMKIQQLLARVEDVKAAKQQLIEDKRVRMEERLQRAAENRNQYLRDIVRKAHDEEEKLKEIAFIKNLEAQNKHLDLLESTKQHEVRMQDIEQERQKKVEEKAAKEAAVERRRQELEQARQKKLEKMNETRLEREQRIGKMQEQREKQRQAIAREKEKSREERLLALQVQQQQTTEELQRKIFQKQRESARRHEENIEHIRQRALELTIPSRNIEEGVEKNYDENQEILDDPNADLSSNVSSDISKENYGKHFRKKMKKLKQRMQQSAEEYTKELHPVPIHMKRESQVPKFLNLVSKGGGAQGLERQLLQLQRIMSKAQINDFQCFWIMDGLGTISNVIAKGMETNTEVTKRSVALAVQLYRNACTLCPQISRHAILGNSIIILFDALIQSLQVPEEKVPQQPVEISTEILLACTVALSPSNSKKHSHAKVLERIPDLISYAVAIGLVEILSRRCLKVLESVESQQSVILSLLATVGLLTKFTEICPQGPSDPTKFLSTAKSSELFGSISMLYSSVVPIGECIPQRTVSLAAATFNLLVSLAVLDLNTFQEVLSHDSSLTMRYVDVITILLKYCGTKCNINEKNETQAVIVDLVATIGFFCANNKKNQDLLTSDQCSIIIKSLSKLPQDFNIVIYPCLVTIIFKNDAARKVISKDFNLEFLDEYSKSEKAKKNHLIAILKN